MKYMSAIVCFFFVNMVCFVAYGNDPVYPAEMGTCRKATSKSSASRAPHLFFTKEDGQRLWAELGTKREDSKKLQLIDKNLKLQIKITDWWKLQMMAAEKTVIAQKEQVTQLNLKNQRLETRVDALEKDVKKWNLEAVKFQGQRYSWLLWGIIGGVAVSAVVGGIVGFLLISK